MAVTIRPAENRDVDALMHLYNEFHNFHADGVPDFLRPVPDEATPELREAILKILANEKAALFVAEVGGAVVGLAEVYLKETDPSPAVVQKRYVLLQSLAVAESQRRSGLGRRLMEVVHQWAGRMEAAEVKLDVWEFPAGPQRFYETLGYRTVKRTLSRSMLKHHAATD